jgi:hypothetical protein
MGHVTALSDHDVTIPRPSVNNVDKTIDENTELDKVIISLNIDDTKPGEIQGERVNIGSLKLTNYPTATSSDAGIPVATDSINGALAKIMDILDNDGTTVNTRFVGKGTIDDESNVISYYGLQK